MKPQSRSRRLRWHYFWLALGLVMAAMVVYVTLTPRPQDVVAIHISDKLAHTLAYLVLMGWFVQIYQGRVQRRWLAVIFVLMGIVLEVLQYFGGVRYMEVADMFANGLGVVIAWLLAATPFGRALLGVEKLFDKSR